MVGKKHLDYIKGQASFTEWHHIQLATFRCYSYPGRTGLFSLALKETKVVFLLRNYH
jgi:uncharacterized protein (DUF779 family)